MISLSDSANERIIEILSTYCDNTRLRIAVVGGGCAGLTYNFVLDEDFSEDDFLIDLGPSKIVIDASSAIYLEGANINYIDELWQKRFTVENPNAELGCGCGSSFAPKRL
jgi:iron-sulfur cluster assembly accessory protein